MWGFGLFFHYTCTFTEPASDFLLGNEKEMGRLSLRLKMLVNVLLLGWRGDLVDEPILASNDCVCSDQGWERREWETEGVGDGASQEGTSTTKHTPTIAQ